jgi:hypothetical protein
VLLDGRGAAARHTEARGRFEAQQFLHQVFGVRGEVGGKLVSAWMGGVEKEWDEERMRRTRKKVMRRGWQET